MKPSKCGQVGLGNMGPLFVIFIAGIITVGILAVVLDKLTTSQRLNAADNNGSFAAQILTNGSSSILGASNLFGVIGIIIVSAVVIGLVFLFRGGT